MTIGAIKNPVLKLARQMIEAGELGEITGFRGIHAEDYMADPDGLYTWRLDPVGGPGVIADLGSHIIGMARFLLGPIADGGRPWFDAVDNAMMNARQHRRHHQIGIGVGA